tara:strand:+ start:142 stop:642 length:501 start_codon:yes stop_codon:yes gene_type:complete
MEDYSQKWDPMRAVENAQKEIDSLGFPALKELEAPEHLSLSEVHNSSDKKLEEYLVLYGGSTAYMEIVVSKDEAIIGVLEAVYNEGDSRAAYKLIIEYEEAGKKKPTNDQIHNEVVSRFRELREQKREIVSYQVALKLKTSRLKAYSKLYDTVSRVVGLRTYGRQA